MLVIRNDEPSKWNRTIPQLKAPTPGTIRGECAEFLLEWMKPVDPDYPYFEHLSESLVACGWRPTPIPPFSVMAIRARDEADDENSEEEQACFDSIRKQSGGMRSRAS